MNGFPSPAEAAPPTAARGGTRHIPSLDGLRAAAVSLVLIDHGKHQLPLPAGAVERAWVVFDQGILGVMVFFVLSGYLITTLLRAEHRRTGRTDLAAFYVRRVLRIIPAFYSFLAVVLLLVKLGWIDLRGAEFGLAALYLWNFEGLAAHFLPAVFGHSPAAAEWYVGHSWTLALEEQFYLCWPLVFSLADPRRRVWVAVAVLVASPLVRVGGHLFFPSLRLLTAPLPFFATDPLMFGVLAALLEGHPVLEAWLTRMRCGWFPAGAASFLLMVSPWLKKTVGGFYGLGFAPALDSAAILVVMFWLVRRPGMGAGRVFNLRWVARIGALSYSLYLWQQIFLASAAEGAWSGRRFPLNFLCCGAAAVLSYHLIEKPFLWLKERFARAPAKPPPGSPAAADAIR